MPTAQGIHGMCSEHPLLVYNLGGLRPLGKHYQCYLGTVTQKENLHDLHNSPFYCSFEIIWFTFFMIDIFPKICHGPSDSEFKIFKTLSCIEIFRCASISCTDHRDWLTDGPKLEIGHSSCLTALSPSVLYSIHGNDMSGQYGHWSWSVWSPDQTKIDECTFLKLRNIFSPIVKCSCPKLQNVFVLNCEMYLSDIAKCIGLLLTNVFVQKGEMYLFQIVKCTRLKLQFFFVKHCKVVLHWLSFWYSIL